MKSKTIGLAVAVGFAALWAFPLARAVSFVRWAQGYFGKTRSINASTDFHYSGRLLESYLLSLLAAFAFAWLISRRPRFWFILPGALLAVAVAEVLWLRPEEPIYLLPVMAPWHPGFVTSWQWPPHFFSVTFHVLTVMHETPEYSLQTTSATDFTSALRRQAELGESLRRVPMTPPYRLSMHTVDHGVLVLHRDLDAPTGRLSVTRGATQSRRELHLPSLQSFDFPLFSANFLTCGNSDLLSTFSCCDPRGRHAPRRRNLL